MNVQWGNDGFSDTVGDTPGHGGRFKIHDVVNMSLREETLREQPYSWSNMVVRRARCSRV